MTVPVQNPIETTKLPEGKSLTTLNFSFVYLSTDDIKVIFDGMTLSPASYKIIKQTITFSDPLVGKIGGSTIVVMLHMTISRDNDIVQNSAIDTNDLNNQLDKLTLIAQQIDRNGSTINQDIIQNITQLVLTPKIDGVEIQFLCTKCNDIWFVNFSGNCKSQYSIDLDNIIIHTRPVDLQSLGFMNILDKPNISGTVTWNPPIAENINNYPSQVYGFIYNAGLGKMEITWSYTNTISPREQTSKAIFQGSFRCADIIVKNT